MSLLELVNADHAHLSSLGPQRVRTSLGKNPYTAETVRVGDTQVPAVPPRGFWHRDSHSLWAEAEKQAKPGQEEAWNSIQEENHFSFSFDCKMEKVEVKILAAEPEGVSRL
ncbi:hypothetical protein SKAU_G00142670 [Synaphobranchus kaupii]|uniref:Uncharacterized protein n=1 Tax=Synaphobranchus kaupii TaxID=118154 RepID=A0A9Q1J454_SYNKA|nr:hypothetical protein SKAU_G00142670 [Synaphobranchus kaupii]